MPKRYPWKTVTENMIFIYLYLSDSGFIIILSCYPRIFADALLRFMIGKELCLMKSNRMLKAAATLLLSTILFSVTGCSHTESSSVSQADSAQASQETDPSQTSEISEKLVTAQLTVITVGNGIGSFSTISKCQNVPIFTITGQSFRVTRL